MSRKYIDDHVEFRTYDLPGTGDTGFAPGHLLLNAGDGTRYVNQGDEDAAIWSSFPANRYELVETFQHAPLLNASVGVASNLDFEILGTNAANTGSTFSAGGGVTLTTTTASGDQLIILPHLDAKQTAWTGTHWNTLDRVAFETTIETGSAITTAIIWAGLKLTNTSVIATDDDQVMVRYEAGVNSGNFELVVSVGGTDSTFDTGVTVAVSTSYHIKLFVGLDRVPVLYINGVKVATGVALTSDVDLIPYVGVQTATTAARSITVRGLKIAKDFND